MSIATVHLGDEGTVLTLTVTENGVVVDLSPCTIKWIKFKKKDASTYAIAADFKTDGTDGVLQHTFTAGELDVKGTWSAQAYVVMPNGKWHTTITTFEVDENIIVAPENAPQ